MSIGTAPSYRRFLNGRAIDFRMFRMASGPIQLHQHVNSVDWSQNVQLLEGGGTHQLPRREKGRGALAVGMTLGCTYEGWELGIMSQLPAGAVTDFVFPEPLLLTYEIGGRVAKEHRFHDFSILGEAPRSARDSEGSVSLTCTFWYMEDILDGVVRTWVPIDLNAQG